MAIWSPIEHTRDLTGVITTVAAVIFNISLFQLLFAQKKGVDPQFTTERQRGSAGARG